MKANKDQLGFVFDEATTMTPKLESVIFPRVDDDNQQYINELMIQVKRDHETLRMDPLFHTPSREFYVERIAAYSEEIKRIKEIAMR